MVLLARLHCLLVAVLSRQPQICQLEFGGTVGAIATFADGLTKQAPYAKAVIDHMFTKNSLTFNPDMYQLEIPPDDPGDRYVAVTNFRVFADPLLQPTS